MRYFLPLALILALSGASLQARPLSGEELRGTLHGLYHVIWKNRYEALVKVYRNGLVRARAGEKVDVGRWHVRGDELCVSFRHWTRGRDKCGRIHKRGRWFVGMFRDDGTPRLRFRP